MGLFGLVLLSAVGFGVVHVVDRTMHENAKAEAIRALTSRVELKTGTTTAPHESSSALVEIGQGPKGAIFVNPLLSDLDGSVHPGETTITRRNLNGEPYYVALFRSVDDSFSVAAAAPLAEIEATIVALRRGVGVSVLGMSLLLAGMAAVVTGRALRSVADMRVEADLVTHGTLGRRLATDVGASELSMLASTLNEMLDRLEASATAQRQFSSDASHELRSPLATIRAQLELAIAVPTSLARRGAIMLTDIDRIDTIVDDLLALSRADEGSLTRAPVDLDELVRVHAERLAVGSVEIDLDGVEHVQFVGDARLLTGLVRNLLDNARRHARTLVRVRLSATVSGSVRLVVEDDGPGVPSSDRARVFDRFTRLDDARSRDGGGAGLGLSVALAAARAHGGSIEIVDAESGGARFIVALASVPTVGAGHS